MTKEIGNNDLFDTWAASGSITEPDLSKKNIGWILGERPTINHFNWILNAIQKKINYIFRVGVPSWPFFVRRSH